jgi:nitrous oxidase accessory protein NosD
MVRLRDPAKKRTSASMKTALLLSITLAVGAFAKEVRVTPGAHGGDGKAIAAAAKEVMASGGGVIVIAPGEYLVAEPIILASAKNLTIRGEPGAILKLAPMAYGQLAADTPAGATELQVRGARGFRPGMELRIMAPGAVHPFTGKPAPHFHVKAAAVDGETVKLQKPAAFAAPRDTEVLWGDEPNLIEIRDAAENVAIEQLTLDGGATQDTPQVATHNTRSGVWVVGRYDYERGPTGPKPRAIAVRDCVIRRFNGRGVAFYSAEDVLVERCRIEQTREEAIDFDHFVVRGVARENDLRDCRLGVEINDANDCTVERNRMIGGAAGVRIWRWCKMPELNVRNRITENEFRVGQRAAIELLEGTSQNIATGNVIVAPPGKQLGDVVKDRGEANRMEANALQNE